MRRTQREIKDFQEIVDVLRRSDTIRLGLFADDYPYIVPLSFGYETDGEQLSIYVHGAREGFKHELIEKDGRACVEADILHRYADEGKGIACIYESVIGRGTVAEVTGAEAEKGLNLVLDHCGYAGYPYDPRVMTALKVYKVTIDNITGKHYLGRE